MRHADGGLYEVEPAGVDTAAGLGVDVSECAAELSADGDEVAALVVEVPLAQAAHIRTPSPTAAPVTHRAPRTTVCGTRRFQIMWGNLGTAGRRGQAGHAVVPPQGG
jgi:hypothetical protein